MKNALSLVSIGIICVVLFQYRIVNSDLNKSHAPLKVTEWDAFGYYMYLPSYLIYHDATQLSWLSEVDKQYSVSGGNGWQALKTDNGNYVFKYLGGVALMQLPLFAIGHFVAHITDYPADGFSPPYQYALGFGIIVYCILSLLLLRTILLRYFSDVVTAITILMVCLATNYIQYAAIDNGQSHAYLFPLYVLILYLTIKWHEQPKKVTALLVGYVVGLATMTRPTEAIMLFIPLFWNTNNKDASAKKWGLVRNNKSHLLWAIGGGVLGVLPQLLYWQSVTGSPIFDVGSKWDFLSPHFRVLFGWEKGWFIYTPITLLFVVGMFFIRRYSFQKSVLWFCLLNIYIIIGWHEWRYGGSYSTRALVQSYPVFALPFAAVIERLTRGKLRFLVLPLFTYLLAVNLFQIVQYCATILHYDDMNRKYYGRIYLNASPTPLDMSLLDNDEMLANSKKTDDKILVFDTSKRYPKFDANSTYTLTEQHIDFTDDNSWLEIECHLLAPGCLWQSWLNASLSNGDSTKQTRVRLFSPISKENKVNRYKWQFKVPEQFSEGTLLVYLSSAGNFAGQVSAIQVTQLTVRND